MKISYDLHIHSCLSPCGDNDMTPNNIVNMASLLGLDVIAVSDHNSALNLPAVFKAAEKIEGKKPLIIPAIEVCTSEEIHLLCLFYSLEQGLEFSNIIHEFLPDIKNDSKVFGDQLILDENDEVIGIEDKLLINAASIGVEKLLSYAKKLDFLVIPAHVDKNANSIIASLGFIPEEYGFSCIEVKNPENKIDFKGRIITDSDAHYLEHISECEHFLEVDSFSVNGIIDLLKR